MKMVLLSMPSLKHSVVVAPSVSPELQSLYVFNFGPASSSVATEWLKGKNVDDCLNIKV